ncbi:MAG: hypothetical protein ACE5LU_01815 [Anaerolineae bacterium]
MKGNRRWLGRVIIGLAIAMLVVGIFALGVVVGEIRGARPALGGEPVQRPWPLEGESMERPWPLGRPYGWKGHRGGHGALGVVDQVEEGVIVMTGRWNTRLRVIVTDQTIFRRGREWTTLADVHVGDRIAVIGQPRGEGEIEAQVIWVVPQGSHNWNGSSWYPIHRLQSCGPFESDA